PRGSGGQNCAAAAARRRNPPPSALTAGRLTPTVVARSPDRATPPTEGLHVPSEAITGSWRPSVGPVARSGDRATTGLLTVPQQGGVRTPGWRRIMNQRNLSDVIPIEASLNDE